MADNLFAEAGRNFQAAGQTAIESENAQTRRKEVDQQPALEADRQIGETLRKAMGDKAEIEKIKTQAGLDIQTELIKRKMNLVKFPAPLAIFYAKKFKRPDLMQLSGQEMPLEMSHAIIDSLGKKQMENMAPKFNGNMMVTQDADGNEVLTDMTKHGFFYRPSGKGSGSGGSDAFKGDKALIAEYETRRKDLSDPVKAKELQTTDPDQYDQDQQWLKDYQDEYDSAVKRMASRGKGEGKTPKPGAPEASSDGPSLNKDSLFENL